MSPSFFPPSFTLLRLLLSLSRSDQGEKQEDPDVALKIHEIIQKVNAMADGDELPFTIELDDYSGNSFIENPTAPKKDPHLKTSFYRRTRYMNSLLGLAADEDQEGEESETEPDPGEDPIILSDDAAAEIFRIAEKNRQAAEKGEGQADGDEDDDAAKGVMYMPCPCTSCGFQGQIRMHILGSFSFSSFTPCNLKR